MNRKILWVAALIVLATFLSCAHGPSVQKLFTNNNMDADGVLGRGKAVPENIVESVPEIIHFAPQPPLAAVVEPESQEVTPNNLIPVHHGPYVVQVSANRNPDIAWRNLELIRREFSNSAAVPMERTNGQLLHVIIFGVWGAEINDVVQRLGAIGFNEVYIRREG